MPIISAAAGGEISVSISRVRAAQKENLAGSRAEILPKNRDIFAGRPGGGID